MAVFPIIVTYKSSGAVGSFLMSTDANWNDFQDRARAYMEIPTKNNFLAFRQFHGVSRDGSVGLSGYGSFCSLTGAKEWEKLMVDLCVAGARCLDVEIEILQATPQKVGANLCRQSTFVC